MKGTDRRQQRSLLPYVATVLAAGADRRSQGLLQPDRGRFVAHVRTSGYTLALIHAGEQSG
jgi:hypothetical protein